MSTKPGRNDPCPCGSGRKYKKCCGRDDAPSCTIPDSLRTGTPFDDYMELFPLIGLVGQRIIQFEPQGKELKAVTSGFEKRFRPGRPGGLTDSLFMSWMHCDLRFGPGRETIAERVLRDPAVANLMEPGPTRIRRLAESYLTFYEVADVRDDGGAFLEELGTGRRWIVSHVREMHDMEPALGDIWYARLVGSPDEAIAYTSPYIYDPPTKAEFRRVVRQMAREFADGPGGQRYPRERHFAESQKEAVPFWAEFIWTGMKEDGPEDFLAEAAGAPAAGMPDIGGPGPRGGLRAASAGGTGGTRRGPLVMVNSDGHPILLAEMKFRVRDEAAVRKRLRTLKSFQHDENDDRWVWHMPRTRRDSEVFRTIRGTFRIEGGFLVAETNSRERAAWFREKLKKHLGELIAYDGTRWREMTDLPEMSGEERAEDARKREELNSRPEIQAAIRKHYEHHYFTKWPNEKVPALGGRTPVNAVKTEAGRRKVEALIEDFERRQDAMPPSQPRIDFDRLRRILGLTPKAG